MTSYYFELTKGMRWWDYTGYFLNLNGRICGEGITDYDAYQKESYVGTVQLADAHTDMNTYILQRLE